MPYAIIVDGVVVNCVEASPAFAASQGWVAAPEGTGRGDLFDGESFSKAEAPPRGPNLSPLAPWRFRAMLRASGHEPEVLAWLAALNDPAEPVYDPQQWAVASAILEYSIEYRFDHPLTEQLRLAVGMSLEQLKTLWNAAHSL